MDVKVHVEGPSKDHEHTHTVIFLHGKGSNCDEFAGELFESEASGPPEKPRTLAHLLPTVKWVFPSAPLLRSERFDEVQSQWFDMWAVENPDERVELQLEGLKQSIAMVQAVIEDEEKALPRDKIFLGGISQGFATAVSAFLVDGRACAGLVGVCSWMPLGALKEFKSEQRSSNLPAGGIGRTPVFLGHSTDDDVVPVGNGRMLRDYLSEHLELVEWHEYLSGGHWINEPQGVDDIVMFLKTHMHREG